jgi:arylsulfatase A-like enzyme
MTEQTFGIQHRAIRRSDSNRIVNRVGVRLDLQSQRSCSEVDKGEISARKWGLSMDLDQQIATKRLIEPTVAAAAEVTQPIGAGPAMVLLIAVWIGLIAGFLDLGILVVNRRVIQHDFYRLGENFTWIIPSAVTILILVPGTVIAVIAWIRGRAVRDGAAVGVLSFFGFLDLSARLPLELWASLLICGGLAVQLVRLVRPRRPAFLRLVRRTVPVLAGTLLAIMLVTIGGRAWTEYRAVAALPPATAAVQNVLLIVWDTVRAGNLSLQGYSRPTTPNLEHLASRGARFDLAFSTSSWTLPSHASLFTGRWPHELGVGWKSPLRSDVPTLAEYLTSHGYDTAGFAANLDYCNGETGLARGFTHFEDFPIDFYDVFTRYVALSHRLEIDSWALILDRFLEKWLGRWHNIVPRSREHTKNAADVDRAFLGWLARRQAPGRPFFAFLNYNDAHSPYEVPDRSAPGFGIRPSSSLDRLTLLRWNSLDKARLSYHDVRMAADVYDDCISYLDRRLGMLLEELSRRGMLDNTLVIVTSDHGEHLGDHLLFFHGCSLYRQLVQVPLVIVGNMGVPAGQVVAEPVSHCDVAATIVDLLGLGPDAPFPGRSLTSFWRPHDKSVSPRAEPLLMETGKPELLTNQGREPAAKGAMTSLVAGGMHYIRTADGLEELYLLNSDPDEKFNVVGSPNVQAAVGRFRNTLALMLKKAR